MKVIEIEKMWELARSRFGVDSSNWKYVCPACGTAQCVADFVKAGLSREAAAHAIGRDCIGRYTGQGDAGIAAKNRGEKWDKGCNWSLCGFLQIHTVEVIVDGRNVPCFELAEV